MKKKPRPLVVIKWNDAWSSNGWKNIPDLDHTPIVVTSVGFLLNADQKGYTLTGGLSELDLALGIMFIPRKMVIKFQRLRRKS